MKSVIQAIVFFYLVFINQVLGSQNPNSLIHSRIKDALNNQVPFNSIRLFRNVIINESFRLQNSEIINELVQLDLISENIALIQSNKPDYLKLQIPLADQSTQTLFLAKVKLYDETAKLTTQDDHNGISLREGVFYQGVLQDDEQSIAAISIFNNEVMGVISNNKYGNIVIGRKQSLIKENERSHVIYLESKLPIKNPFTCAVDEIHHQSSQSMATMATAQNTFPNACKAVKVYLECANRMYTDRQNSKTQVEIYITGAFNVVKALYAAESVNIEISEIKVWTTPDPYLKTTLSNILYDYSAKVKNNFNGTLAQLITTYPIQQQGGIAFVNGMCRTWDPTNGGPHSFAYIFNNYSSLPTYSWTVEVMAHEMGHNFGSWHTHSCVWGPNKNSQIDNCQPADIGSCNDGKTPVGGGTVMSYCHLTGVGINFSKGFGKEPGDILRNAILTKSCIPASYTPFTSKVVKSPYYEGDSIRLQARPFNNKYIYEWFNHDYIFNKKDTAVTIKKTGIYTLAVSNVNCTEYAKPDTFEFKDFLVNLGCPVIEGKRDSFVSEVNVQVDNSDFNTDSLIFPNNLYSQVPNDAKDVRVELQMNIAAKSTSFVRSVISKYSSPDTIGIVNDNFIPNENHPFSIRNGSFTRILGNFDPAGIWKFSGIDTRSDAMGYDALVTYKIVLSWRTKDSVSSCDLYFCDNKPLLLDAGVQNGSYTWTTGATTKILNVSQEGPIGVSVKKGSYSSSHTVNMVKVNTHFAQSVKICEGSNLKIGNKYYDLAGIYVDTLMQTNGCDSILTTSLEVINKVRTRDTIFKCFNELYNNVNLVHDTTFIEANIGSNNCDSVHSRFIKVNPRITSSISYEKKCNNEGTSIRLESGGGSGRLSYRWSNGESDSIIVGARTGTYTVEIKDENSCLLIDEVKIENFDSISIHPKISEVKCFGQQNGEIELEFLTGTQPFIVNWNIGQQGNKISSLASGKYVVIITDFNGCRLESSIVLGSPDLLFVDAVINPSFGANGSISLNVQGGRVPYRYQWSTSDTTSEIFNLPPGNYTVTVSDNNACSNVQTYSVQSKVGVKDYNFESQVLVSPNPFRNQIIVESQKELIDNLRLHDYNGRMIIEQNSIKSNKAILETSKLTPSIYFLNVRMTSGREWRKHVVKLW
ncbi:MAG: T9SS type A sorting domain-containing protein [Saprospiraceae bacterium]|nr:T9SS type A sorting domain-containing protein [Saprospiraceae bacterium]